MKNVLIVDDETKGGVNNYEREERVNRTQKVLFVEA